MAALWAAVIAGFLAGFIGSLGLGGGAVLVIFLTVFAGMPQLRAQGVNLLFFIPIGLFALLFHIRRKLVVWKAALPAILCGLVGAGIGAVLTRRFGGQTVRLLFGGMLLLLGAYELFFPHRTRPEAAEAHPTDKKDG